MTTCKMKCIPCDLEFHNVHELILHKKTGCFVPLECSICGESWPSQKGLVVHLKNVHNKDPQTCPICKTKFKNKRNLTQHLKQKDANGNPRCKANGAGGKCTKCGKVFVSGHAFLKHVAVGCPHVCAICKETFSILSELNKHIKRKHQKPEDRLNCEYCNNTFSRRGIVTVHIKRFHPEKLSEYLQKQQEQRTCPDCGMICKNIGSFAQHRKYPCKSKRLKWKCKFCDSEFDTKRERYKHQQREHNNGKSYQCDACDASFPTQSQLDQHKMDAHSMRKTHKTFDCDLCGDAIRTDYMIRHTSLCHKRAMLKSLQRPVTKKVICSRCKEEFPSEKYALHVHQEVAQLMSYKKHEEKQTNKCKTCNVGFCKQNYNYHIMAHMKKEDFLARLKNKKTKKDRTEYILPITRPYVCGICNKRFVTCRGRNTHVKRRTCQQRYHCSKCNRSFKLFCIYSRHSKKCEPLICDKCEKTFATRSELSKHKRASHNPQDFQCPDCKKKHTQQGIYYHMTKFCPGRKFNFQCPICPMETLFQTDDVYRAIDHLSQCTNNSKNDSIECHICRRMVPLKKFPLHFQREALHSRLCKVNHNFECPVCELKFPNKRSLNLHNHLHPKETKIVSPKLQFICCNCNVTTISQSAMESHFQEIHGLRVPAEARNKLTLEKIARPNLPILTPVRTPSACFICGIKYACPRAASFCVETCSLDYCIEA